MAEHIWQLIVIIGLVAIVFAKLGAMYGRMSRGAEDIVPISTTRISPEARARIEDALGRRNKIEAIKILRADTGCGLAEAKKTVEALRPPELG